MSTMKKILVLCDHGQVRSVAMAMYLRERDNFAVAGSYDNWVKCKDAIDYDLFIFLNEGGLHYFGIDNYGDIYHPELKEKCMELIKKLGL